MLEVNPYQYLRELTDKYSDADEGPTSLVSALKEELEKEQWHQSVGIPSIPEEKRPGTRARYLSELAARVTESGRLLITEETDQPFAYCETLGCYRPVRKLQAYLNSFFQPEVAASIPVREYRDICERLTWEPKTRCTFDELNPYPDWVNLSNGVYNLVTGELVEHSKDFRFNYCINAEYLSDWNPECEGDSSCEAFNKFCQSSLENDPLKRRLLLEFIGYICSDQTEGKCALFLKGLPDSGKSVVSKFAAQLFDPNLVSNVFLHELGDKFLRAELVGRKLNVAGEIAGKPLSDISQFKSVTGGDRVEGQFKHKDPFYFSPKCKLLFAGNTLPLTTDADATAAYANRLRVLLFNSSVKPEEQDKDLLKKLWDERNCIVTMALHAVRELIERNYKFTEPADSREFLASFALRGNVIGSFLDECCILSPKAKVFNTDLCAAFEQFCHRNGLEPMTRNRFYALLSGIPHVFAKRLRIGNENRQGHSGITLKDPFRSGTLEQKS
ncbi:MAG: hypothetical protein HDT14_02075 [Oscillibacter sp.]|nr:hypothetical protein [Oscillibacter sp.]